MCYSGTQRYRDRGGTRKQRPISTHIGHRPLTKTHNPRPPQTLTTIHCNNNSNVLYTDTQPIGATILQSTDYTHELLPIIDNHIVNSSTANTTSTTTTSRGSSSVSTCSPVHSITNNNKRIALNNVLYQNAQSVRNKTFLLFDMILEKKPDIMFITETWLAEEGDEVIINELTPNGYKCASYARTTGPGGGICVIHKDSLKVTHERATLSKSTECVKIKALNCTFLCVYHPSPSSRNGSTKSEFLQNMELLLEQHTRETNRLILLGDFNLHFDEPNETYTRSMITLLDNHGISQLVHFPTHKKGHILDWISTNPEAQNIFSNLEVSNNLISDHSLLSFHVKREMSPGPKRVVKSRNIKGINIENFKRSVVQRLRSSTSIDPTEKYNESLRGALNEHAPVKTRTVRDRPSAPWYTERVRDAKRKRRATERRWKKSKCPENHLLLQQCNKDLQCIITEERRNYLSSKVSNCKNSRTLFKLTDEMKGETKSTPMPLALPDPSNAFGDYFQDKITSLRKDIEKQSGNDENVTHDDEYTGQVFSAFRQMSPNEIKEIILSCEAKSCDLDPIPTKLLLECLDILLDPITNIINQSLESGHVPSSHKIAIITPIIKKRSLDQNDLKNYRPVSNLPFISKVLEKVVLKQLQDHLRNNNLLEPLQSAYRQSHSTESALLRILNDLLMSVDSGKVAMLTLLDLSAAFDTIDHQILCNRLSKCFGLSETVLFWFRSYLTDRSHSVSINKKLSRELKLRYGVPQGSVLGPTLYLLYTMPLGRVIRTHNINFHMFADDTQLYKDIPTHEFHQLKDRMEDCCQDIKIWMNHNKLKLNDKKTEILLCASNANREKIEIPNIKIDQSEVVLSEKAKNLGVILDNKLTLEAHINNTVKLANFELRRIRQMKKFLPTDAIKTLVVALVLSRLDYCNSLLAGLPEKRIKKLQRVQNNAARMILDKDRRASSKEMLKTLHWLPIKARIDFKIAVFCYNSLKSTTSPAYLQELLTFYTPQKHLRSQDKQLLDVPRTRLKTFGDRSFTFFGSQLWNSLPTSLRNSPSLEIFRKQLKTFLFRHYLV